MAKLEIKMVHTQYLDVPEVDNKFTEEAVRNITEGMKERFGKEVEVFVTILKED